MPVYTSFIRTAATMALASFISPSFSQPPTEVATLLKQVRTATGAELYPATPILRAQGREQNAGLRGRWSSETDLGDGRHRWSSDYNVFQTGAMFDGEIAWKIDPSGGVHALNGAFMRRYAVTDGWLARFGYLRPSARGVWFGTIRQERSAGRDFDVVEATPHGGEPVELWFDERTHLLAKTVRRLPTRTVVEELSDYRNVNGFWLPFRFQSTDDASGDADTVDVDRYELGRPGAAWHAVRPYTKHDTVLAAPTNVRTEVGRQVVVEATLNGQGPFDFILDTGGHNIITPEVAARLRLRPVGNARSGGAGAGTLAQQDVVLRSLHLGNAQIARQHFYVIPLQYDTVERGARPPLAGILGLELLERLAVRIDYRRTRVTLIPFGKAARYCEGKSVPLRFDDDIPLANGSIEGSPGVLAIDTGNSGSTVVQGVWARSVGLATRLRQGIETTSFGSGGSSTNWITRGGMLKVGAVSVPAIDLRLAEDHAGAFSSITEAGNVGQQVLANYTVLFDYSRSAMCLFAEPGYAPPPLNRAGLSLSKQDRDHFLVASVNATSPASAAGLEPGDLVVSIADRPASNLSNADVFQILRQPIGTEVPLVVIRSGTRLSRRLKLAEPK